MSGDTPLASHKFIAYLRRMDRQVELDLIDAHIAVRGVTRCPDRYIGAVDLAMPEAEIKARLTAMLRPRPLSYREIALRVSARRVPKSRK